MSLYYGVNPPLLPTSGTVFDPSSVVNINSATTLSASSAKKTFLLNSPATYTVTLPQLSTLNYGDTFVFYHNYTSGTVTLATNASDTITYIGAGVTTLTLTPGDIVVIGRLVAGTAWTVEFSNKDRTGFKSNTPFALTDAATITPDFSVANNFTVTIAGNRTLANPTNIVLGQSGVIGVTQDATGSRTLAFGSFYKFKSGAAPTLTTTAAASDELVYYVESSTRIWTAFAGDVK